MVFSFIHLIVFLHLPLVPPIPTGRARPVKIIKNEVCAKCQFPEILAALKGGVTTYLASLLT